MRAFPVVQGKAPMAPVWTGLGGRSGARPILGAMHQGGEVQETGAYNLEKGEKVLPKKGKAPGRSSEYRKVYVTRRSKKK